MTAWTVVEVAAGALAASVLAAFFAGRYLASMRHLREVLGERPFDEPEHLPLEPPPGYRPRTWLIAGARVVHDEHGLGKVVAVSLTMPFADVGVLFDDGAGRWVPPSRLDPITPDDEALLVRMLARRMSLNHTERTNPDDQHHHHG